MSPTVQTRPGPRQSPPVPAAAGVPTQPGLKPRCALKVAVVGNRRFAGELDAAPSPAADRLRRRAGEACVVVWQTVIASIMPALETPVDVPDRHSRRDDRLPARLRLVDFLAPEPPRLAVLSALAAGGDQLGAQAALDAGGAAGDVIVELEAILPFPEADYPGPATAPRPEFRPDEAATLARLTARAAQVVRLDGHYGDPADRTTAYRHARDTLLEHADMVLAIYDPDAAGGPAGTLETVDRSLAASLPVVAVLLSRDDARVALYAAPEDRPATPAAEWARAAPLTDDAWRVGLADVVARLLLLPHQRPHPGEDGAARERRLELLGETVGRLRLLYGEAPPHRWCRGPGLGSVFGAAWAAVLRVGTWFAPPHGEPGDRGAPDAPAAPATRGLDDGASPTRDGVHLALYASTYKRASALADVYMRTYRGAFVLAFTLAGVAVVAAVLLMVVSMPAVADSIRALAGGRGGAWLAGSPPLLAVLVLGGLKIGIILFLVVLERVSYQARYQEHATDFRYLAEMLRPIPWLAPLGARLPAVVLPTHLAPLDPRRRWMPWLVRAVARGAAPVAHGVPEKQKPAVSDRTVTLDAARARAVLEAARSIWLGGQVAYHRDNARRMHAIDEGLERLAKALLWTVLALAVASFALKLLYLGGVVDTGQLPFLLGAGAAMLPAFIAALAGIMFQSEARRLRARSEAMYDALQARQREIDDRIAALEGPGGAPDGARVAVTSAARPTAQHLRALAAMMIAETGDWKILYQTHEIHAG